MSLPTHLQMVVLGDLVNGERSGIDLRQRLSDEGFRKSAPAFYQLMARLEDAKWVEGWYEKKDVDGQVIRERRYHITGNGRVAVDDYAAFATRVVPKVGFET